MSSNINANFHFICLTSASVFTLKNPGKGSKQSKFVVINKSETKTV